MCWCIVVYLQTRVKSFWAYRNWSVTLITPGWPGWAISLSNSFPKDSSNFLGGFWLPGFRESRDQGCGSQHSICGFSLKSIIFSVVLLFSLPPNVPKSTDSLFCPNHGKNLRVLTAWMSEGIWRVSSVALSDLPLWSSCSRPNSRDIHKGHFLSLWEGFGGNCITFILCPLLVLGFSSFGLAKSVSMSIWLSNLNDLLLVSHIPCFCPYTCVPLN